MKKWDIITGMDSCMDMIVSGNTVPKFRNTEQYVDNYAIEMGGSGPIFISQCAKLGLSALGIGARGDDAFGELFESELRKTGADTSRLAIHPAEKTGLGLCLVNGEDRAILTYSGTIDAVTELDFPDELLAQTRHLHIASYFLLQKLRPRMPDLISRARRLDITVSMDTNWDPDDEWQGVHELLPELDVFIPNEHEAAALGGADALSKSCKLLVVKEGERGACAYAEGRLIAHADAYPAPYADAVGAGDSFDAGFIAAWLKGLPVEMCLHYGCACGSMNVRAHGGVKGQGTAEEIKALVRGRIA